MKNSFLLLIIISFISCREFKNTEDRKAVREKAVVVNGYDISIIEYDSCEYLISGVGYSQMMTHKGNCKYCEKRHKNCK